LKLSEYYREVGNRAALSDHLAPYQFIGEDGVFFTMGGDAGVLIRVSPVDVECWEQKSVDQLTYRLEQACRIFDERCRVYQYLFHERVRKVPHQLYGNAVLDAAIKTRVESLQSCYSTSIYYAVLRTSSATKTVPLTFSVQPVIKLARAKLEACAVEALEKARTFVAECQDFLPCQVLGRAEAFHVLRKLLNFDGGPEPTLTGCDRIGYRMADSTIAGWPSHLQVGSEFVKVLTLKDLPSQTKANLLGGIGDVDGEFIVVSEFQLLSQAENEKKFKLAKRLARSIKPAKDGDLKDKSRDAAMRDLDAGQEKLYEGARLGMFSLSVVVHGADLATVNRVASELQSNMNTKDCRLTAETLDQIPAYLACVPGNYKFQFRDDLFFFSSCWADMSFACGTDSGEFTNQHLRAEYLALMETRNKSLYGFNLHYLDVGHSLVIGRTGSGKSFSLNWIITNAQKYRPYTLIFDLGGSFESVTRLFGGSYFRLNADQVDDGRAPFSMNPFAVDPTPRNLDFLALFVRVLLEQDDEPLTPEEDLDVYRQIRDMYVIPDARLHRLGTVAHSLLARLARRLEKWVEGGQFSWLFDNELDTVSIADFQCFDFQGMGNYPKLLEPLLLYILHRADGFILNQSERVRLKTFFIDEAWVFLRNKRVRSYVTEALKTWRKHNAAVVLSTQSIDELRKSEILDVILESCATRIFLANPTMDEEQYQEQFKLNATEVKLISRLVPKREMLIKTPDRAKVVVLQVDRKSYYLYANSPLDNARRTEAFERYGFDKGLEVLANG
jgi:type IV secretion system protein TrbE